MRRKRSTVGRGTGPFFCPDCDHPAFASYQARYQHQKVEHGLSPKKSPTKRVQHETSNSHEGEYEPYRKSTQIDRGQADLENAINRLAGRCQAEIDAFAAEFGIPASILASGVADILLRSPGRRLHRPPLSVPALSGKTAT
jgi:hypothetical protein